MPESQEYEQSKSERIDPKERFREVLEKKKKSGGIRNNNIANSSKIQGGQASGSTPKMFRRKSGSA